MQFRRLGPKRSPMKKTLLLVLALLGASNAASAQTTIGTYSAFWSGLPVGTVTISNRADDNAYAFTMTLQSGGILGDSRFTTYFSGQGRFDDTQVAPIQGDFTDVRRGETRTEQISFGRGLPTFTSSPAYIVPEEFRFDLERTRGALDPSSGLFALLHAASINDCNRRFRVYDGFSLFSAHITDEGQERVRTKMYRGMTQKCRLTLTPIAGKAAVFGSFTVPEMEINVANLEEGAPALPVKGALFINGNRAGLRFDEYVVQ